ncbi:LysM peptidoglycan-binding domain-containing protein [Agrobacterium larrymoorei]|uniref:LysM peptidoglycan-binding domain-containing protein n=1 Tax=Agrobacterium larrymoorei TaxID=160699 RepID=UPI001572759C|nr:LysM peptidoglycan-binding domain-containing protein [Agrobacterium larrymoorei]NTJ41998.1 LysM peptidoglycan-binding domain-containing protein [Agrobacterium larrymoorei]
MKNKRAGLLALIVLGVATLLMVFFVLPRMSVDDIPAGNATNEAANGNQNGGQTEGEKPGELLSDSAKETATIADKVGRLAESATQSIKEMTGLFAGNTIPSNEQFAAARAKVEASLRELNNVDIPETLDETTSRLITTARTAAERAMAFLRGLPTDPNAAAAQVRRLAGVFAGTDDGAARPEAPAEAAAQTPATPAAPQGDAAQLPSFDVLRVEPDGSAVIAGKAQPGSELEIINKGQVIARAPVESSGDFAAVLDNPLSPGDHELVLRSTNKDGKVSESRDVATVSVPKEKNGELLAMVTTPGKASRVLAMPDAAPSDLHTPAAPQPDNAAATSAPTAPATAETASTRVTAVEFDGSKIFIAGSAPAGTMVRALVDDARIGQARAEASGSFVIEGDVQLSVGNHIITAEALDGAGNVSVRVRVPFARPETDQATVAMQQEPSSPSSGASTAQTSAAVVSDLAAFEALRTEVSKAFGILSNLYQDGKTPALDEVAAAKSATVIALRSLSEFRTAATADAAFTAFVNDIAAKARSVLDTVDGLPNDVAAVGRAIGDLTARMAELNAAAPASVTSGSASPAQSPAPAASGPKTFEQAPLAHSDSTVIIRRGDTLWQISRRVYGQGVRYTTIYLANQEQIKNPDLIEPGQIFGVPEKALPDAEEIHRKRLKSQ